MWTALIGPIANIAATVGWMAKLSKQRQKQMLMSQRLKLKRLSWRRKLLVKLIGTLEMARASSSSWKDEWLVILFSIPLILAFIPGMEGVVQNGFDQLNRMPEWYQYGPWELSLPLLLEFVQLQNGRFFG